MSKVFEKVISEYMSTYKSNNDPEVPLQSAYCQHHSTETALLKVHNDIFIYGMMGNMSFLY